MIQPVVKPVVISVSQPVVSCKRGLTEHVAFINLAVNVQLLLESVVISVHPTLLSRTFAAAVLNK